jgi:hypothetical protein
LALLLPVLLLCACNAPPREPNSARPEPPADFSLGVTVFAPGSAARSAAAEPSRRPARYVLESDGVLRASFGSTSADEGVFPPQVRQLNRTEQALLWARLRNAGLLDEPPAGLIESPNTFQPPARRVTYLFTYRAQGHRRAIAIDGEDQAASRLVAHLAELAWAP